MARSTGCTAIPRDGSWRGAMTEFIGETQRGLSANQNNIHHRVTETLRKTKSKAKPGAHGGGGDHGGVRFSGLSVLVASISGESSRRAKIVRISSTETRRETKHRGNVARQWHLCELRHLRVRTRGRRGGCGMRRRSYSLVFLRVSVPLW